MGREDKKPIGTMQEIQLRENTPFNSEYLKSLFGGKEDLFLVWPKASFPFDEPQWSNEFSKKERSHSLLFYLEEKLIGHAGISENHSKSFSLIFVFLIPEFRGMGVSCSMIKLTEQFAVQNYNATKMTLIVRDYNQPALKFYLKQGYKESSRDGTAIRMEKVLA